MSTENLINWDHEATSAPITSWADFEEEQDSLNSSPVDSQVSEEVKTPLSSSSEQSEEDMSSTNDRSPQTESFGDRMPRSSSHNTFPRSNSSQKLSKDAESYTPPKPSVKEQIPFPTVAPFVAFVSNLSLEASQRSVHQAFESISASPKTIKIILEKSSGRPRGFCYVEFATSDALRRAIESDGLLFMSQPLHIVVADQKKDKPSRSTPKMKDQDKGKHPRMDSVSMSSKGKAGSSSPWRMREEIKPRSSDRGLKSEKSSAPRGFFRERPGSIQITTDISEFRKVDESRGLMSNNMFSTLKSE